MALIDSALTFDLPSWDETQSSSHIKKVQMSKEGSRTRKQTTQRRGWQRSWGEVWEGKRLCVSKLRNTHRLPVWGCWTDVKDVGRGKDGESCGGETTRTHNMDTWICKFTTFQLVLVRDWGNRDQLWRNGADIKEMLYKMISFVCLLCGNSSQCWSACSAYSNNMEHCWEAEAKQDKELTW